MKLRMDTVLTETRSVLQQDMLMKYIIQTMLQNVWRSVPLWVQHLEKNVIRENSDPGDIIILLGGRTGRDGCGGATGSSKVHTEESIETCGAEVQKGNPPTERKIQRLFRREEVSRLIKKCNDFGAGGVP